jgi:hypothetical protein
MHPPKDATGVRLPARSGEQAELDSTNGGPGAVGDAELGDDMLDVPLDRV